jgi:hypothetical protein
LEKEELMRWNEKEKMNGTSRKKWMDRQEHEVVMLNLSIMAEKLSDDRLVEEKRTPMDMFWKFGTASRSRGAEWGRSKRRRWRRSSTRTKLKVSLWLSFWIFFCSRHATAELIILFLYFQIILFSKS